MEGIQKRATKMVIELRALSYEDRLKEGSDDFRGQKEKGSPYPTI